MIRPDIVTRDDSRGLTYFIAQLNEGTFALFSLFDNEASEGLPATLDYVDSSVENILATMKEALRASGPKATKRTTPPKTEGVEADDGAPRRRKRIG